MVVIVDVPDTSPIVYRVLYDQTVTELKRVNGRVTLGFGSARSYAQCVAGRFLSGLLNGNAGVVKTYIGETTNKAQQAGATGGDRART